MKNDHQASLKRKREENQKLVRTVPRKASLKHVLRVNHFVSMLNTDGLRMFRNIDKLKDWGLHEGCLTGKFPAPMPRIPVDWVPASLSVCTDQEQTQITGGEFIFGEKPDGLGCTGARLSDDFHRWSNDLNSATAKAGLKPVEKAATLIFNIGYGPWQKAAWFHLICSAGHRLSKAMKPSDKLLQRFFGPAC